MKLVIVTIAAAALASACASTASDHQLATNACSSASVAEGEGFSCGQNPGMTPAALHDRADAKTRARTSNGRY